MPIWKHYKIIVDGVILVCWPDYWKLVDTEETLREKEQLPLKDRGGKKTGPGKFWGNGSWERQGADDNGRIHTGNGRRVLRPAQDAGWDDI